MGNNMVFFQFYTIIYRVLASVLILAVVLGAGCTPLKTEKPESSDIQSQEDIQSRGNSIHAIDVYASDHQVDIRIKARDKLAYTSIKQDFPLGIALYLPGAAMEPGFTPPSDVASPVEAIRTGYADTEQTTAKIEILLSQDLPYEVTEQNNELQVLLFKTRHAIPGTASIQAAQAPDSNSLTASSQDTDQPPTPEPMAVQTPALMTNIEFNTNESGYADIQVKTTHPVRYETAWHSDTRLDLILYDTRIPAHHQRPLRTQYFNAAVDRILPGPGPDDTNDAKIEIMIREKVPFRVVQDQDLISLHFDPASAKPPLFEKAVKPVMDHTVRAQGVTDNPDAPDAMPASADIIPAGHPAKTQWGSVTNPGESGYVGEKIKLDFFDTDIRNVFRILKSVSGLNFAVDKDVQGKVTMTLETPIPWDQVLDLVLKMNGLGKKMEGNVVRIATIQTLKQEEQDLQDTIAAQKKALDQKKSLEPLVTEYIPINYAEANVISEHFISERGNFTVDERTNMIIATATEKEMELFHEMIFQLDKVTPQIMIEAKVVEVTKDFSRSIGVGWNLTNDPAISSLFVNDMNVSVNTPVGDGGVNGDFSFFRMFGSSVTALNAKLAASEVQGDARVISSPRILTLDNREASITQGVTYVWQVPAEDPNDPPKTEERSIPLTLKVTPRVTNDKRIGMTVELTKDELAGINSDGSPIINTNATKTELLVNDKETVVIGGVVKTSTVDSNSGLPFLSKIPIIGNMILGQKQKVDNRNELLIFLTPSIVQLEQKRHTNYPAD
jgi:type IV pilus assembly protein PilQ